MALKIRKFRNIEEANLVLNGAVYGGRVDAGVDQLVGKTLTFSAPAGTKTFTQGSQHQGRLSFAEIKSQLEGAITNLRVYNVGGFIVFAHASGTAVSLGAVNETGRAPLGLPNNKAVSGTVYAGPGGSAPKVSQVVPSAGDAVICLVEEV